MTATTTGQRATPTVQANPALLQEGDMIYPDMDEPSPGPFRVTAKPKKIPGGYLFALDGDCQLFVPRGDKVRTQRRPNDTLPMDPEAADAIFARYREPRYV